VRSIVGVSLQHGVTVLAAMFGFATGFMAMVFVWQII
jgi:hypothetical protein